ncbi:cytochrome P450 [Micromonosporaceae bacterium B7E4]
MVDELSTIDLADPGLHADGDPHAVWRVLRERSPVHWQPVSRPGLPADLGFWAVTRYPDVARVLAEHDSFSSEQGTLLNLLGRGDPASGQQLAATDPPRHDRMRAPLYRAMNARPVEAHAGRIRAGVTELLAPGAGGEPFDLAAALTGLPLVAIGPLLGLPAGDWPELSRLAMMCTAEDDPDYQLPAGSASTLDQAHRALFGYFSEVVRQRTRSPGDDLVSLLLGMRTDGERARPGAVVANCYSLLLGASVTLPHVPAAALVELAGTDRYADWADRPDLLDPGVEEALRWASPASHFMRVARRPVSLHGRSIPAGAAVVAWLGAANRDPAVFADPDAFDIRRRPNRHLAFGSGRHYCIGSHLARLTLRLLFAELFRMFRSVAVVGEPVRVRSTFLAGIKRLPVVGQPRRER